MEKLIHRNLLDAISKHLDDEKIIGIRGPRQSGKSTLLEMLRQKLIENGVDEKSLTFLTFEDPSVLEAFISDPRRMLKSYMSDGSKHVFLLDEVQYDKEAGRHLKLVFDTMKNLKIFITGSSSMEMSQVSKSLVGRILLYELLPLSFGEYLNYKDVHLYRIFAENNKIFKDIINGKTSPEVKLNSIFLDEINREFMEYSTFGGYPDVVKHQKNDEKIEILKNIYTTYIGKDVVTLYGIEDTMKLRKVLIILSAQIGSLLNYNTMAREVNAYYKEFIKHIDVLEQTYVVKLVRPFSRNLRTELRKNPKVYFIDIGMRNYMVNNFNELGRREDAGHVAENLVFSEISRTLEPNQSLQFWRTLAKAEVDFILWSGEDIVPLEVKFSSLKTAEISKGMHSFISAYKPKVAVIATKDFIGNASVGSTMVFFIPIAFI